MNVHSSGQRIQHPWLPLFLADFCAITAAYATTFFLRFHSDLGDIVFEALPDRLGLRPGNPGAEFRDFYISSAFRLILILTGVVCLLYALGGLYERRRHMLPRPQAWSLIKANALALAIFYSYWYLQRNVYHPRSIFTSVMALNVVYGMAFRHVADALLRRIRVRWGGNRLRILLAGSGKQADFLSAVLEVLYPHGSVTVSRIPLSADSPFAPQADDLTSRIRREDPDLLIFDGEGFPVPVLMQILDLPECRERSVKMLSDELEVLVTRAGIPCDTIRGLPLVHFDPLPDASRGGVVRRGANVLAATVLLLALGPLMLLIAGLIRLTSHGQALFIQERIGMNRIPFRLYKFRTMHHQAEAMQAGIESFNESGDGTLFKIRNDPRITRLGRFLRRFSLDELPQLFNIIRGDMLLIGPRPLPRRDFSQYNADWQYRRHDGLPGLTCLWQICGRSNIGFVNMCILDIYYLRNRNWILDVKIALKTIRVVIFGEGAY